MPETNAVVETTTFVAPIPPDHLVATLELHTRTVATSAQFAATTIATAYDDGDLSARETVQALYAWDALIGTSIKLLERAKEAIRDAMEAPAIRLASPVELAGLGTVSWIEPTPTVSYPMKDIARLSGALSSATQPLAPTLEHLQPLLDRVPQLVALGHLGDEDGAALVDGVQQLALIAHNARAIAAELQQARKDGTKSGYVKVEAARAKKATPADEPPF